MDIYIFLILILFITFFVKYYTINKSYTLFIVFILFIMLLYVTTKNINHSIIGGVIIYIILQLIYKNKIEKFENNIIDDKTDNNKIDNNDNNNDDNNNDDSNSDDDNNKNKESFLNLINNKTLLDDISNKLEGGIKFNVDDLNKTKPLQHDFSKNKDDNKNEKVNAQKDVYDLIDSVKTLQDTIETLGPVLSEGKKIMDMFENFKL